MKVLVGQTELGIIQGDLTEQQTDAIVNAANSGLMGGGGVDGAIHRAGGPQILAECKKIVQKQGSLPPGEAVITSGGNLRARYVIHTVGPIWHGGNQNEPIILRNAYYNSLKLAKENGIKTIAFPSISTGVYSYPLEKAAGVALTTVLDFIKNDNHFKEVNFVLFNTPIYNVFEEKLKSLI